MPRFTDLIDDINNQGTDNDGVKGEWIKATKHSKMYNSRNLNHPDIKGWKWFVEVNEECKKGNILIYKVGKYNYFVLPKYQQNFLSKFPNAVLKIC
jgi:hypothetical protein